MPIEVDLDGNGTIDKDLNPATVTVPDITDESGDGVVDVNLTQATSYAIINGAIFADAANVGSGTGNYNTFLALQDRSGNSDPDQWEAGFNSNDTNPLDSTNTEIDASKTHTVLLGAVPITIIDNVAYYEFRIDLNESNSSPDTQISLDQFRLYTSTLGTIQSTADLFDTTTLDGDAALTSLRYDMDAGANISVLLSEANSSGSGNDDYTILVPVSNFAGLNPATTYLYLYAELGHADGPVGSDPDQDWITQGGFEEFNLQNAIIIQGTKFLDTDGDGVRDPGEGGMEGVTIYIDDDLDGIAEATDGNGVLDAGEQSTITDANGNYAFGGIPILDASYQIEINEVVPPGTVPTTPLPITVTISSQLDAGTVYTVDPIGNRLLMPDFTVVKAVTSITDGADFGASNQADSAGDVIHYSITIDNTGEMDLHGFAYSDQNADGDVITYVSGDDGDGVLETNEVWIYSGAHTVTQAELDGQGSSYTGAVDGDSDIDNRVTVDFTEVGPRSSTVETPLIWAPSIDVTKAVTAVDAAGNGLADRAGDLIAYSIVIDNTGNVTLSGISVTDQVEAYGATNATYVSGDLNSNGLMEVNETWTFAATYTLTQADLDGRGDGNGLLDNVGTGDTNETPPDDDTETVPLVYNPDFTVVKAVTSITDDGDFGGIGQADSDGDVIHYSITVANTGNITLTGFTYVDQNADGDVITYDSGDTDSDGNLDVGETWLFSAAHTVTQAELDSPGSGITGALDTDGDVDNRVTVDFNETTPRSSTVETPLIWAPSIDVTKAVTAVDAAGNGLADRAGDLIAYSIVIDNTGNVTLSGISVTDQVEAYGATNATYVSGDLNSNGLMEVNETWTFAATYTLTQADLDGRGGGNGLLDNVGTGDTNETPPDDDTETVPLVYNPDFTVVKAVTSITDDGDFGGIGQADSDGDVIHYSITVANTGNITLTGFTYVDQNADGDVITYDSGDTDSDGNLDVGETWLFSAAHTVTQAELDGQGSSYTGTIDGDSDIDNRVTVDFNETTPRSSTVETPLIWAPSIDVTKAVTAVDAAGNGLADRAGDLIAYSIVIDNTGNVTLSGISVTDQVEAYGATNATYVSGDLNSNGLMEVNETWTFAATYTLTQADLDGRGGGNGLLDNVGTGDTNETPPDSDTETVPLVYNPVIDIEKFVQVDSGAGYGGWEDADSPRGPETSVDTAVNFLVVLTNTGNITLTGIHLSDMLYDYASNTETVINYSAVNAWVDLNGNGTQEGGEAWSVLDANNDGTLDTTTLAVGGSLSIYYSLAFAVGQHTNTATVTTTQSVTDSDAANYYGIPGGSGPGVRTPGFWTNWTNLWNGVTDDDPRQAGQPGFPDQDILYSVDSNNDGFINFKAGDGINDDRPLDSAGLLIGDFNMNGIRDDGEDVFFISLSDAQSLVNASKKTTGNDGVQILGRDVVATWLNFLAGNGIGSESDPHSPRHFIEDAVDFLQTFGGKDNDGSADTFDVYNPGHATVRTSSSAWNTPQAGLGLDHSGSALHSALDGYNNTGTIAGTWYAGSGDDPGFLLALSQAMTP